jgi:hypothetical protein
MDPVSLFVHMLTSTRLGTFLLERFDIAIYSEKRSEAF